MARTTRETALNQKRIFDAVRSNTQSPGAKSTGASCIRRSKKAARVLAAAPGKAK